jgi:hypothetical protein
MELGGVTFLLNNVALLALLAAGGPADAQLKAALLSGDLGEVPRLGASLPTSDLRAALQSRDRLVRLAACRAAPAAQDGWVLLAGLARAAATPDRPIAACAARSAVVIARALDREHVEAHDIPDDALRTRLDAWRAVGADPGRWPDVRVHALEVSAYLARALGPDATPADVAYDLGARLADHEPEVRRAALELIPHAPGAVPLDAVAKRVTEDRDDTVALVAAQVMCAGLAHDDPPAPVLAAMGEAGLARLRTLVLAADMPPAALFDAARCLAADAAPASKSALASLAKKGPRSIRRRVARLARKGR